MTKFKKNILVFSLLFVFMIPVSKAWYPLIAGVTYLAEAAATTQFSLTGALTGIGLAALIGQRMGMIDISFDKDDDGVNDHFRIPTTGESRDRPVANADVPLTTQPTSTTTQGATRDDALNSFYAWNVSLSSCPSGYSKGSGYTDTTTVPKSINGHSTCYMTYSPFTEISSTSASWPYDNGGTTVTCAAPYVLTNGQCVMTEQVREAIPDKNCDLKVSTSTSGSTYISNSSDPDCGGGTAISDGKYSYRFAAELVPQAGVAPKLHDIVLSGEFWAFPPTLSTGVSGTGSTATITTQPVDRSTPTRVIAIDTVDGVVTGVRSNTVSGNLAQAGTTYVNAQGQTVTVGANDVVIVNPATTGVGQVAATAGATTIPTDYARTGEAATAATSITSNLQADELDNVAPMTSINTSLDALEDNLTPKDEDQPLIDFAWLPSILPGSFTGCQAFPIDVNPTMGAAAGMVGHGELDICSKLDFARQLIGYFLGLVTVFFIFRTFTNSNKAAL